MRACLDRLLERRADGMTWIEWLRTPAADASPRYILGQLENRTVGSTSNTSGQGEKKWKKGKKKTQYNETTTTSDDEVTELRGQMIRYR